MSFAVTPARIKYVGYGHQATRESRCAFLAASPKGVAISKPTYTPTSNRTLQSSEAQNADSFFGLAMAPTLAPKDVAHIGIAIDGVATALMKKATDDDSNKKNALYGSMAYGIGTRLTCENGELRKAANNESVVALYLQKNGPNTALVWIHKNVVGPVYARTPLYRPVVGGLPPQFDGTKRKSPEPDEDTGTLDHAAAIANNMQKAQAAVNSLQETTASASAPKTKSSSTKRRKTKSVKDKAAAGAPVNQIESA